MASSDSWITLTPKMARAVDIMNIIETKKFHLFLNRIIQEMKQNTNSLKPFSDDEKEKLQISFSVDADQLNLLLHSCILILSQAVYHITNPEILNKCLIEDLEMNEDKALAFSSIWSANAKSLVFKLKQKPVYSNQLEDVSWLVNIETASQEQPQTFTPKAVLQLKVKSEDGSSNIHLGLTEGELYGIYNALENIQNALDTLM